MISMKKRILMLLAVAAICFVSGCSEEKKAGESTTDEVDQFASSVQNSGGEGILLPSESVTKVLSDTWVVSGSDEIYVFEEDGTGAKDGGSFTFECGFDDEKNITLKIVMDDTKEESLYAISSDDTGYGIDLTSLDEGENLKLLPENLEFMENSDERVQGLLGTWSDGSGNQYTFEEDGKVTIESSDSETEGTFNAVADENGNLFFRLRVEGGSLEFEYKLSEDGNSVDLVSPGTDTIHTWTKE